MMGKCLGSSNSCWILRKAVDGKEEKKMRKKKRRKEKKQRRKRKI